MTAKKKSIKAIAKKKTKTTSQKDVKVILNSKDTSAPSQETLSTKPPTSNKPDVFKIYEDEKFQKPLGSPITDIIKILTKNPWEAFIFWNINPDTFQKSLDHFQTSNESVKMEICLDYNDISGVKKSIYIPIHPLSNNYYYKFESPAFNLKALIYANHNEGRFLLFDSAQVSLPSEKASFQFDEQWINQEWIDSGIIKKDKDGNFIFNSNRSSNKEPILSKTKIIGSSGNTSSRSIGS